MIGIIAHHFAFHGNYQFSEAVTINRLWIQFLLIGGKVGVNIFILISGYFMILQPSLRTNKVLKFLLQVLTYSILSFVIFGYINGAFSIKSFIKACFPITFSQYWFAGSYFVLILLSPYLNLFLKTVNKKLYQKLLILLTVCWSIIPTITNQSFQCNDLLWFIYLYSLAAYFRIYGIKPNTKARNFIFISAATFLLTFFLTVLFDILGTKTAIFRNHTTFLFDMEKLPILLIAVFGFLGFSKISIGQNKVINLISITTFDIYLIHDNRYVRSFLWKDLFRNAMYSCSNIFIIYSVFVILIVFVCCFAIGFLRIHFIEKKYLPLLNKISYTLSIKKEYIFSAIYSHKKRFQK